MRASTPTVPALVLTLIAIIGAAAALTAEEAKSLFEEMRCNSCHVEGGPASSWEKMVEEIGVEWPAEFDTIDEAARNVEYFGQKPFKDFTHLMQVMGQNVGADEEKLRKLEEYFRSLFEEAKKQAAEKPVETQQPAEPAPAAEQPQQPSGQQDNTLLVIVAAVVVIVVVGIAVYMATKGRV